MTDQERRERMGHGTDADRQVEKEQAEKEKLPKPADHAETDKELGQKRGARRRGSKTEVGASASTRRTYGTAGAGVRK
jgi:hypothetical protein